MKHTISGVTYKQHKVNRQCEGCAVASDSPECNALIKAAEGCQLSWKRLEPKLLAVGSTIKVKGEVYVAVPEERDSSCEGCVLHLKDACEKLQEKAKRKFAQVEDNGEGVPCNWGNVIWKLRSEHVAEGLSQIADEIGKMEPEELPPPPAEVELTPEQNDVIDLTHLPPGTQEGQIGDYEPPFGAIVRLHPRSYKGVALALGEYRVVEGGRCGLCAFDGSEVDCESAPYCLDRHYVKVEEVPPAEVEAKLQTVTVEMTFHAGVSREAAEAHVWDIVVAGKAEPEAWGALSVWRIKE